MNKTIMGCVVLWCCALTVIGAPPRMRRESAHRPPVWDDLSKEKRCVKEIETIRERLDRLYSLTNESSALSKEAQKVFRARIDMAEADYADATNELARIQVKLTPERRAELEASKRTHEELKKLNAEIDAFENSVETKRRNELECERTARERALNEAREKATEAERVKRESEAAKQKIEREAEAAKQKAEREELARKRAAASEELAGWPKGVVSSEELLVHGTNVEKVIAKCCPEADVEVNGWWTETKVLLAPLCEKALNVVLMDNATDDRFRRRWEIGCGKSLIECDLHSDSRWKKYDDQGRLVKWAKRSEFPEYVWITKQHAAISARLREEWAKKHDLTMEQAEKRAKELIGVVNPRATARPLLNRRPMPTQVGSLRAQRAQRRAEERARMEVFNKQLKERGAALEERRQEDAARREEEQQRQEEAKAQREEQRKQRLQIQEELRKAREEEKAQQL